jgi:2-oxoisovalerate dehydrogenase E2 component (dihydrolipoyl transacylase)
VPAYQQFRLPDLGEGLTEGEILQWYVKVGDTVTVNQTIVEIETAKAAVELPCPFAGVVTELLAEAGTTVAVGSAIISVDTDPDGSATQPEPPPAPVPAQVTAPLSPQVSRDMAEHLAAAEFVPAPKPQREAVLVGYGVMSGSATRRPRRVAADRPGQSPTTGPGDPQTGRAGGLGPDVAPAPSSKVRAKPPVRKLAKDLGVDLAAVTGSGPHGTVTRDDVQRHAAHGAGSAGAGLGTGPGVVLSAVGPAVLDQPGERREHVRGVRKHMAEAMVRSAFTVPHVTEWVDVDVTRSVKLVHRLRQTPGFDQTRVSPLLLVARAVLLMAKVVPDVNAVWDEESGDVVFKEHVNLGFAADTPRGLVVPNIKAADRLSLPELALALKELVETARAGRTTPADMAGGTFTITNVGVFGIDGGTPIINPGEAAILAVGAFRERPWVHKGKVRPRWVVQLALSFDHRFIDGATGARFLGGLASVLSDPAMPPVAR